MSLKHNHPMCIGPKHLQMEELRLESCDLPNVTGSLAETAFLNPIVVLWLPSKRNVKGLFVLILLIKAGLDGLGEGIQDPRELWSHGWLGRESQMPWTPRCREGLLDLTRRARYP